LVVNIWGKFANYWTIRVI